MVDYASDICLKFIRNRFIHEVLFSFMWPCIYVGQSVRWKNHNFHFINKDNKNPTHQSDDFDIFSSSPKIICETKWTKLSDIPLIGHTVYSVAV